MVERMKTFNTAGTEDTEEARRRHGGGTEEARRKTETSSDHKFEIRPLAKVRGGFSLSRRDS
jgi:hypothetical protein